MDIILVPTLLLFRTIADLAIVVVVSDVVISWFITAGILNVNNQFVYAAMNLFSRISEFMLRPIRERVPSNIGTFDISPVVFILLLTFLENATTRILMRLM